jgi:hypothetical protein
MLAPFFGWEVRPVTSESSRLIGAICLIFFGGGGLFLSLNMRRNDFIYVSLDSALLLLYFILNILLATRLTNAFSRWRLSPDVALAQELRSALRLTCQKKASEWRSFSYRRQIATHLIKAANILEGPMLHILPGSGGGMARIIIQTKSRSGKLLKRWNRMWFDMWCWRT